MKNTLTIKGNEIKITSKDIIEMPEEIKTPQGLFLFLKNNKNEIEEVTAKAKKIWQGNLGSGFNLQKLLL